MVASYLLDRQIRAFSKQWLEEHTADGYGPLDYVAEQVGISVRSLYRMLREQSVVAEDTAEKILMAMDKEHMLKTGEIPIVPTPYWSFERWLEWRNHELY